MKRETSAAFEALLIAIANELQAAPKAAAPKAAAPKAAPTGNKRGPKKGWKLAKAEAEAAAAEAAAKPLEEEDEE